MVNVLMVAEKPSIAQTLADALSSNHKYSTRTGVSWLTRQLCLRKLLGVDNVITFSTNSPLCNYFCIIDYSM